jgi:peptidoglycan glycosyltransferase
VEVECRAPGGHGRVSLTEALALPCKVTLASLAARVPPETLAAHLDGLGLRDTPDIELAAGPRTAPPPDARPPDMIAWLSDGGGRTTPLGMCGAVATIANHGMRMQPYLVEAVTEADGRVLDRTTCRQLGRACSANGAEEVAELMAAAAQRGTAGGAGIADIQVAGLAASSRQPDGSWASWFAGFAPAEYPAVAVAAVIEDGGRSGDQAAALAGVALRALLR